MSYKIEKRKMGSNGPTVSAVGLGCMGMSDFYGSKTSRDVAESLKVIQAALQAGVSMLNTGDFYGAGHNELLIREALRNEQIAERPLISVKFGALRSPRGEFLGFDGRPAAVKNFAAYSLIRLGTDVIDLYQPARLTPDVPLEDTIGAVKELIEAGHVRYLGLSEASADQLRRAHAIHPVTAIEVEYSLATRIIERELLSTARELGVAVVAYGVQSRGLLSGGLPARFEAADFRAHLPRFIGENFAANRRRVAVLEKLARERACTPGQVALSWVLHQGEDIFPLIGTTKRTRLDENLRALQLSLSPTELHRLEESFADGSIIGDRYPEPQMGFVVT